MSCKIASKSIIGEWGNDAVIAPTNFKFKSLCEWVFNTTVGCRHGCRFCFVPSVAVMKQKQQLAKLGVSDPAGSWGDYVFVREWDEKKFLASLDKAMRTPEDKLKPEGHRAIMLSSTCDPYQVFKGYPLAGRLGTPMGWNQGGFNGLRRVGK